MSWNAQTPPAPLRTSDLVAGALALLRARIRTLIVIGAIGWAVSLAWTVYGAPRADALGMAVYVIPAMLNAAVSGLMIRAMLTPAGAGWLRPDGGFIGYVGLTTVLGLPVLFIMAEGPKPNPEADPFLFAKFAALLLTLVFTLKFQLWFLGVLMGQGGGPAQSWRRMRGAVLPFILANIWLVLPALLVLLILSQLTQAGAANPLVDAALMLGGVAAGMLSAAVTAALWGARGEVR